MMMNEFIIARYIYIIGMVSMVMKLIRIVYCAVDIFGKRIAKFSLSVSRLVKPVF